MVNIRLSILKRVNYAMSEGSKTALPQDWLVLAIFGIVTAAGATGQSAWFIIYGILCLVARDIAHYWDIICKAWSLPDWRATVFVWWNLFTQGACFAFACYGFGFGLYKVVEILKVVSE